MQQPQFSIETMTLNDIEPATYVRLQSWLETYVNEEAGVTREWVKARNEEQLSPERVAMRKKWLQDANGAMWVAKDLEGNVIGVASPRRDGKGLQRVGSLYVDKKWQGKGVGGQLMQQIIDWSNPTQPIYLGVASYNERAKGFYQKWGFKEIPDSDELFDNVIPTITMIRKGDKQ
jgi:GNAT superfamily N-acetyltransferase